MDETPVTEEMPNIRVTRNSRGKIPKLDLEIKMFSKEEHSSGFVSKYQVKSREPKVALNMNEHAPFEEFPEFKVKIRTDKERIKEFHKTVRQLKKEKAQIEQWNAHQQERIQGFKKKKKEKRALLKELREINFRLY